MRGQQQFLEVIDRDEAQRRFDQALGPPRLDVESVPLHQALGRILACDVAAAVDVPAFDRSNVDGYAVHAADTFGAREEAPRRLRLTSESIATGCVPQVELLPGHAAPIATGGMIPRGADAVVMVEHTEEEGEELVVRRAVASGTHIAFAATDISSGEVVVRQGELLTSRETGALAAIGQDHVEVWKRPRVAILSTGDEIIAPGEPLRGAQVFDSNQRTLADAVRECGAEPVELGIFRDDLAALRSATHRALADCDVVLLSGGTSKGAGDLSYRVAAELTDPGLVAHGVALKPGKPICLAVTRGKPLAVLPGFPTSAIFTFHEFVAPVIRRLAGRREDDTGQVLARLAVRINSEIGRTEYVLVGLVESSPADSHSMDKRPAETARLSAFPLGKGSGSVTAFSRADGFLTIERQVEILPEGTIVPVRLIGRDWRPADLVVIGSQCAGLDYLLGELQRRGWRVKFLAAGSTAGLSAAQRGECDVAGLHLLDPQTGQYNLPFVSPGLRWVRGYRRRQGLVYRAGDSRFADKTIDDAIAAVRRDPHCRMVNRHAGSGTRILIDRLLAGVQPPGYAIQPRNHQAVVAAVAQGRADWGVAIEAVALRAGLLCLPICDEEFDFVVPEPRWLRPAVIAFRDLLREPEVAGELHSRGCAVPPS